MFVGRGTTTRIAANIFPQQPRPGNSAPNANYSAAISSGLSQLGLGRGKPSNPPGKDTFIYSRLKIHIQFTFNLP